MRIIAFLVASALAAAGQSTQAGSPACLKGLSPVLSAGGFSGSVNCVKDRLTIRRVGELRSGGHRFTIYDYRYWLAPVCLECAVHGGHRLIVLRDGIYLGQYGMDFVRIDIAHGDLILTPDGEPGGSNEFTKPVGVSFKFGGPPSKIWVGGEFEEFFR